MASSTNASRSASVDGRAYQYAVTFADSSTPITFEPSERAELLQWIAERAYVRGTAEPSLPAYAVPAGRGFYAADRNNYAARIVGAAEAQGYADAFAWDVPAAVEAWTRDTDGVPVSGPAEAQPSARVADDAEALGAAMASAGIGAALSELAAEAFAAVRPVQPSDAAPATDGHATDAEPSSDAVALAWPNYARTADGKLRQVTGSNGAGAVYLESTGLFIASHLTAVAQADAEAELAEAAIVQQAADAEQARRERRAELRREAEGHAAAARRSFDSHLSTALFLFRCGQYSAERFAAVVDAASLVRAHTLNLIDAELWQAEAGLHSKRSADYRDARNAARRYAELLDQADAALAAANAGR